MCRACVCVRARACLLACLCVCMRACVRVCAQNNLCGHDFALYKYFIITVQLVAARRAGNITPVRALTQHLGDFRFLFVFQFVFSSLDEVRAHTAHHPDKAAARLHVPDLKCFSCIRLCHAAGILPRVAGYFSLGTFYFLLIPPPWPLPPTLHLQQIESEPVLRHQQGVSDHT